MNNKAVLGILLFSIFAIVMIGYVNAMTCYQITQPNANQISSGWNEACAWLRENTTEPADYYSFDTEPTWGVVSWWDYGYWITRTGQRPAMCNPGSNIRYEAARLFLSDNYTEVHQQLKDYNMEYIVIDYLMTTGKFYAIDTLAHAPLGQQYLPTKYQQDYIYWDSDKQMPIMLNYEEYYKSTIVRLYNFNGLPVASPGTPVFEADENRNIIGIYDYPDLNAALNHIEQRNAGFIAGADPFLSQYVMPEDLTKYYKLVWQSQSKAQVGNLIMPEVKIFKIL